MAKMPMDVQEKMELLAQLEAILGGLQSLQMGLQALMTDVAAIRNTTLDGPGGLQTCESNWQLAADAKPLGDQALGSYDDLLVELADPNGWRN
jgi:hypothetical protein